MREEFDNLLCQTYPKLYANRHGDVMDTLMCWGFECGDGWFTVIDRLSANIQSYIDWKQKSRDSILKWNEEHPDDLRAVPEVVEQVVVTQVKEKFGGLRFYYEGGDEHISGMVRMAESWAAYTCEECGSPGKFRHGGWLRTLCDDHEEQRQQRLRERDNK